MTHPRLSLPQSRPRILLFPPSPTSSFPLQNCHLAPSWLPQLEACWEAARDEAAAAGGGSAAAGGKAAEGFRLWLTSMPTPAFPPGLLQAGRGTREEEGMLVCVPYMNTCVLRP